MWVMAPWGGGRVTLVTAQTDDSIHTYTGPYQSLRTIGQQFYGYESGPDDARFDEGVVV